MTPDDLAVLDAVKRTRVKTVADTGSGSPWRLPTEPGAVEPRAWSLGGNVD